VETLTLAFRRDEVTEGPRKVQNKELDNVQYLSNINEVMTSRRKK
jgi:hypothetical protein